MKRLLVLIALAALAMAAAGCDVGSNAAVVNGDAISQSTLNNELSLIQNNPDVVCYFDDTEGSDLPESTGAGYKTVPIELADSQLTDLIVQQIVQQQIDKKHLVVSEQDLSAAETDLTEQLASATSSSSSSSSTSCGTSGQSVLAGLPASFRSEVVRWQANQEVLTSKTDHVDISNSALESFYNTHLGDFNEYCLGAIVADSQANAQALQKQLSTGTSFPNAATSSLADTSLTPQGGLLPCLDTAQVEQELTSKVAEVVQGMSVGQISSPQEVETEDQSTGQPEQIWLVLGLKTLQQVPFAQTESGIRQYLLEQKETVAEQQVAKLVDKSSVWLDPRFGAWSSKKAITAPDLPPLNELLSPTADQGNGANATSPVVEPGTPGEGASGGSTGASSVGAGTSSGTGSASAG